MKTFFRFVLIFSVVVGWTVLEAGAVAAKEPPLIITVSRPPVDNDGRIIYRPTQVVYRIPATPKEIKSMKGGRQPKTAEEMKAFHRSITAACGKDADGNWHNRMEQFDYETGEWDNTLVVKEDR